MPPEQHRDFKNVDERADIYAIGIILYMLHNGDATHLDPSRYPSNIRHVIKTAVQPEKDNRYRTVNELRKAWHEATSQIVTISIAEQVQQITKSFAESGNNILPSPLDRLHHLLTLYQDDGRLLHDGFMGLVPLAFRLYGSRWSEDLPVLIKKFVTYTTSHTTWRFIYIDEICNRCRSWYVVSDDIDIKADLVCCVFELAYKHDRHISIRIFLDVIQMPKIPGEGQAIADRLGRLASLQPGWVTEASERLTPSRLEASIRAFFCPSDPMGEV